MRGLPNSNFSAFNEATERLRKLGHEVYNPAEGASEPASDQSFNSAMRNHLGQLLNCEAVMVLPAWGRSEGAKIEVAVARSIGLPIHAYHHHRPEAQVIEILSTVKIVTRAEVIGG
jgi:hypothetical protein